MKFFDSYIESLKKKYKSYSTPVKVFPHNGLIYWRKKLLLASLFIIVRLAPIAYIPSIILSVVQRFWGIAVADTAVYLIVIYLYLNRNLSIRFRIITVLVIIYLLGLLLVLAVGSSGAGYLWLFVVPVLTALLLEKKYAAGALILNSFTMILLGYFQYLNIPLFDFTSDFSTGSWSIITANFIFLNILATIPVMIILDGLESSMGEERDVRQRLEKQSDELLAAKENAEKADRLKSEFLAQMSHEIRTPINTIFSFISLIREDVKIDDEEQQEQINEYFKMIENGSRRVIRTVDLILNMSELESGNYEVSIDKIELIGDVLLPVLLELKQTAKRKGLQLNLDYIEEDEIIITADKYTVAQIFVNLIDNAIKYTQEGSVKINYEEFDDKVRVDVADTGIGISKEYIAELFKPFSQEEAGYSRKFEGTGLGLTLVKKYCELNNADIIVESEKGKGSKFSVIFKKSI